jgi:hypothetical protein
MDFDGRFQSLVLFITASDALFSALSASISKKGTHRDVRIAHLVFSKCDTYQKLEIDTNLLR